MCNIEPVGALSILLSIFTSTQVAEILAPYIIIIIGSFTGASWTLGTFERKLSVIEVIFFYVKSIFTAVLITVFTSHIVSEYIVLPDKKWLFAPIAFMLGMVSNKWVSYFEYMVKKIHSKFDK